jgi:hypothetical protein
LVLFFKKERLAFLPIPPRKPGNTNKAHPPGVVAAGAACR